MNRRVNIPVIPYALTVVQAVALFALGFFIFRSVVGAISPDSLWQDVQIRQVNQTGSRPGQDSRPEAFEHDPFHREEVVAVAEDAQPEANAPETTLNLKLTGRRSVNGRGTAVIRTPDGTEKTYVTGDEILNGVRLRSVFPAYVVLSRADGTSERLTFAENDRQSVIRTIERPAPQLQQTSRPSAPDTQVEASLLDFLNEAGLRRKVTDGRVEGYEITRELEKFKATGLNSGDILTHINGTDLRQGIPDFAAMSGVGADAGSMSVQLIRNGQSQTLEVGL
ncbi:MAG: hypothetical protein GDA39_08180 [Hyphomonadaceae bacterium]|nr:hypothetical protein [Hyphomonadaceae bacterium]MBC6412837.1 hypothetical protein [Hyphomonadaceae bacterium]